MNDLARWNLKVSRETDIALRTHLAERGGKKGDLSRYVEDAVNLTILREALRENWERNRHLDPAEVEKLVDEELAEFRRSRPRR